MPLPIKLILLLLLLITAFFYFTAIHWVIEQKVLEFTLSLLAALYFTPTVVNGARLYLWYRKRS